MSPKYVETNAKVLKTFTKSTDAISSPSTSKFVTCNTTLTSPNMERQMQKYPIQPQTQHLPFHLHLHLDLNLHLHPNLSYAVELLHPQNMERQMQKYPIQLKLNTCHLISICIWISIAIYIQICHT